MENVGNQVIKIEPKEARLEKAFEILETNFKAIEDQSDEAHRTVENIDNTL